MKTRKLVLFITIFIILLSAGVYSAFRFFDLDRKLHDYVVAQVSQYLEAEFEASSISITPWSLGITKPTLKMTELPLEIEADRIRIEFNLFTFLLSRFHVSVSPGSFFLDNPKFIWDIDSTAESSPLQHAELSPDSLPPVRINFVEGSFMFREKGNILLFATGLEGWVYGGESPQITARGQVLSTKKNTSFNGFFDKETKYFRIDVISSGMDLSNENLAILTKGIIPVSGKSDLKMVLEIGPQGKNIYGDIAVQDAFLAFEDRTLEIGNIFLKAKIADNEIVFENFTGNILDSHTEINGKILFHPAISLDVDLKTKNIDAQELIRNINPDSEISPYGDVNIYATIQGPLQDPVFRADLVSPGITIENEKIENIRGKLTYNDLMIDIRELSAEYRGFDLLLNANSRKLPGKTALERRFDGLLFITDKENQTQNYSVILGGEADFKNGEYRSDFKVDIINPSFKGSLDKFTGNVDLNKNRVLFSVENENLKLNGNARNLFSNPRFSTELELIDFPVAQYAGFETDVFVTGDGSFQGNLLMSEIEGDFHVRETDRIHSVISGKAQLENIFDDGFLATFEGILKNQKVLQAMPMIWNVSSESGRDSTKIRLVDGDGAVLEVTANHKTGGLDGELELYRFPLEKIIDVFRSGSVIQSGKITGNALIGGTLGNPYLKTEQSAMIEDLDLGGFGNLYGTCDVFISSERMSFADAKVKRHEYDIMEGDALWEKGKPLIVRAHGREARFEALSDIFDREGAFSAMAEAGEYRTEGKADYDFTMTFTRKEGAIEGNFIIEDGHFFDIPFDVASGRLTGGSDGFRVEGFEIRKQEFYSGKGEATSGYFWMDRTEGEGLRMELSFNGELLRFITIHFPDVIRSASGDCTMNLSFAGIWQEPVLIGGNLTVSDGSISPGYMFDTISRLNGQLIIDPQYATYSGLQAVRIENATGRLNNHTVTISNNHPTKESGLSDEEWLILREKKPELLSLADSRINLDFGILAIRVDRNRSREEGIQVNVPGFMQPREKGRFQLNGSRNRSIIIGASYGENRLAPYIFANIDALTADITYPIMKEHTNGDSELLEDIFWDMTIRAGKNVNYFKDINPTWGGGIIGTSLLRAYAKIDENAVLEIQGRISDNSLRITGNARVTSGTISFLGTDFDIERVELDLDTRNVIKPATLTGRAKTTVFDSLGTRTEIYLNVYSVDQTGRRIDATGSLEVRRDEFVSFFGGRAIDAEALGILHVELTSNNPADDTQEKILARLGISPQSFGSATARAFTAGVDHFYITPILRPVENAIKRVTGLDVVRFTPSILGNLVQNQLDFDREFETEPNAMIFDRSSLTLGEYLNDYLFLSYNTQYGMGRDFLRRKERGFYHELTLQYMVHRNTRVQLNLNYDDIIRKSERRFEIRHDSVF